MTAQPTLLVVEDAPGLRYLARLALSADFAVDDAEDGGTALEREAAHHYDPIMLDVMMPGLDGYAVCERIRAMPGGTEPKIVFCAGLGGLAGRARGGRAGAEGYIVKPSSPSAPRPQFKELLGVSPTPLALQPPALSA